MSKMFVMDAAGMKKADEGTIYNLGIAQDVLMERAALAVVECVEKYKPNKTLCICGTGNNGGDAIAVARILSMREMKADVYMCGSVQKYKPAVKHQLGIFEKIGGRIVTDCIFLEYDMIVDGIFGIGLERNADGEFAEIIKKINLVKEKGTKVISVDIPSGIHTDKGIVMGTAVKADETIAFGYYKPGHLLYPGAEYCGDVTVKEIGICHQYFYDSQEMEMFTVPVNASPQLPKRQRDGNKGTFGRVLVIAGSQNMYGACYLSALAAFRTGVGLVDVYTHEINREALQNHLPEAIIHTYQDETYDKEELCKLIERADCVVIGPGLSVNETAKELVKTVFYDCNKNIVADADALNCIAQNPELLKYQNRFPERKVIITPHPGEFSRLTGLTVSELKNDYVANIKNFAKDHGVIVVGKDAGTVVSDGRKTYMNQTGNDGMATAGSGDVLSGIIAGLLAQKEEAFDAAWKGVWFHGKAADVALQKNNKYSLMAGDIANFLAEIL